MLNMDFTQRVVIDTGAQDWVASPMAGVWRKPLAREDAERGHATSIVRYDAGARFRAHNHPGGEEILVLEGTFSDETGDFHAGTYFRNPVGFRHAPYSEEGCVILVKLHQFNADDEAHVVVDTHTTPFRTEGNIEALPLHTHGTEQVCLLRLPTGETLPARASAGGEEIYVISGAISDEQGNYGAGCWLRGPRLSAATLRADEDSLIWHKSGHLPLPAS